MEPNEPIEFTPPADLRVTNAALGPELADENGRTTLKLVYLSPASEESDEEDEEEAEDEDEDWLASEFMVARGKEQQRTCSATDAFVPRVH